jgi:hypothetical protein
MIDTFSLALAHGLLFLAAWRLMQSSSLDHEDDVPAKRGWSSRPDTE